MTFQSGVGCHMNNVYMRALSYADDVTLLSQSIRGMNYMLEVFKSLAEDNCIIFNSKKTVCV